MVLKCALFSGRDRRWRKWSERLNRKVAVSAMLDSKERLSKVNPQVLIDRCFVQSRNQSVFLMAKEKDTSTSPWQSGPVHGEQRGCR
jgi:hypothetical protein